MRSLLKSLSLMLCVMLFGLSAFAQLPISARAAPALAITGTPTEPAPPTTPPTTPQPTTPQPTTPPSAPTSNPDTVVSPSNPKPRIVIKKTVDQPVAMVGDLLGFSIHVSNEGNRTANNVVVSDGVPGYLEILDVTSSKGSVNRSGNDVRVDVGSIAPDERVLIRIRAYVRAPAPESGSNTASTNTGARSTATFQIVQPTPSPTPAPTLAPPTPTLAPSVPTPSPTLAPPAPTAKPAPTPKPRPVRLPVTAAGDDASDGSLAAMLFIGAVGLVLGLAVRRRI